MRIISAGVLAFGLACHCLAQESPAQAVLQSEKSAVACGESQLAATELPKVDSVGRLWEFLCAHELLGRRHVEFVSAVAGLDETGSVRFLGGGHAGQFEYHFRLPAREKLFVLRFARSEQASGAVLVGFWLESLKGEQSPAKEPAAGPVPNGESSPSAR